MACHFPLRKVSILVFVKESLFPLFFQHLSWVAITIALLYHLSGDGRNSLEHFLSNVRRFFPSIFCGIAAFLFQSSTHFLCSASISIALFPQPISETHFRQCTNIGGNINLTLKCIFGEEGSLQTLSKFKKVTLSQGTYKWIDSSNYNL